MRAPVAFGRAASTSASHSVSEIPHEELWPQPSCLTDISTTDLAPRGYLRQSDLIERSGATGRGPPRKATAKNGEKRPATRSSSSGAHRTGSAKKRSPRRPSRLYKVRPRFDCGTRGRAEQVARPRC